MEPREIIESVTNLARTTQRQIIFATKLVFDEDELAQARLPFQYLARFEGSITSEDYTIYLVDPERTEQFHFDPR